MQHACEDDGGLDGDVKAKSDRLRAEIRRARKVARRTQQNVADALGCTQGKIQKIERGPSAVKPDDLLRILQFLDVSSSRIDELEQTARECRLDTRRRRCCTRDASPEWFREFRMLEQVATNIASWQQSRIPGLLQSEQYMWRQFVTGNQVNDVNALYLARKERKQVLDNRSLVSYRAVLGEEALMRMPGGGDPMLALDQVQYVLKLIKTYPKVSIQVLRFEAKLACPPPGFTIMRLPAEPNARAFVEHSAGIDVHTYETSVKYFTEDWHVLLNAALTYHETREFLEHRVAQLRRELASQ